MRRIISLPIMFAATFIGALMGEGAYLFTMDDEYIDNLYLKRGLLLKKISLHIYRH